MHLVLFCNIGLLIISRYYDFNDSIPIVNISVSKQHLYFNMVDHKPFNGTLNLIHSDVLLICI